MKQSASNRKVNEQAREVIAGILLFIAGIILDVMAKNDRKAFIIDANQFAMMRRKK